MAPQRRFFYSGTSYLSVIAPYEIAGSSFTKITVNVDGVTTTPDVLAVAAAAPGILMVLNQDYRFNSPADPAAQNSVLLVYATGEGQTNPPGMDGKIASTVLPKPVLPVSVTVGGKNAALPYAGAVPNFIAGFLLVIAPIPPGVTPGAAVPLVLKIGSFSTSVNVAIW
jgi:uncharacterized protein (TIGR03437 family)